MDVKIKVGKVTLAKWDCPICGEESLTGYDSLICSNKGCSGKFQDITINKMRVIASREKRKPVGRTTAKALADEQGGACFWCENEFGSYIMKQDIVRRLEVVVDHVIPWSYSLDHGKKNLVAPCQVCNGWKSALVFDTVEDCRGFLKRKWSRWEQSGLIVFIEDDEAA